MAMIAHRIIPVSDEFSSNVYGTTTNSPHANTMTTAPTLRHGIVLSLLLQLRMRSVRP